MKTIENIIAFILYLSIPPAIVWNFNHREGIFICITIALIFFLLLGYKQSISSIGIKIIPVFLVLFIYTSIRNDSTLTGLVVSLLLPLILINNSQSNARIIENFTKIYSILLIPSFIVYVMVIFLKIPIPYTITEPLNALKTHSYFQYPFLVTIEPTYNLSYYRFMSWFDEPGVVGTISGCILLMKGLNWEKWETYPLIISGIFSFSLAFYILLLINVLLFNSLRNKLPIIIGVICLMFIFYNNDFVNRLIFDRFAIEDGTLAGNNRTTSQMDQFMKTYIYSDKVLFGYGHHYSQIVNQGGSSYKNLIIDYGIIYFILLLSFTIVISVYILKDIKTILRYMIIWWAIIFQRPYITMMLYFSLLYLSIIYIKYKTDPSISNAKRKHLILK